MREWIKEISVVFLFFLGWVASCFFIWNTGIAHGQTPEILFFAVELPFSFVMLALICVWIYYCLLYTSTSPRDRS